MKTFLAVTTGLAAGAILLLAIGHMLRAKGKAHIKNSFERYFDQQERERSNGTKGE